LWTSKKLTGVVILITIFIIGCFGNHGNIRKQAETDDKVNLAELRDNWDKYDIYYGMKSNRLADAIMFDPKDNGKNLEGDSWIKIEDQETLDEKIKALQSRYDYAKVHIIEGVDNRSFGYMYYGGWFHVYVKIVDEQTLYVSSLPHYITAP